MILGLTISDGFSYMLNEILAGGAVTYFFIRNLGLKSTYAAAVWAVFTVWNTLDEAIAGYISDKHVSAEGRRVPYIRFFAPIVSVFFCLAFIKPPFIQSQIMLSLYFFAVISILDLGFAFLLNTIFTIPVESTLDDTERGRIYFFEAIGNAISLAVPMVLIPSIQPDVGDDTGMFSGVMFVIAVVSGIAILLSLRLYKKGAYVPDKNSKTVSLPKALSICLKNRNFLCIEFFGFSCLVIYTMFIYGMYYYFDEIDSSIIPCAIGAAAGLILSFVFFFRFLGSRGAKWLTEWACLAGGISMLLGLVIHLGILAFFGFAVDYGAYLVYFSILYGNVVDAEAARTGLRLEGTFSGVGSAIETFGNGTQTISILMLAAFGYQENLKKGMQTAGTRAGIWITWLLIPALISIASGLIIHYCYSLDQEKVTENREILSERQIQK
jgi:Na+/melibiose symporter-like transporter